MASELDSGAAIGRYRVLRRLGAGAMGVVYLARDPQIERLVAIKTVRPGVAGPADDPGETAERHERLLREARTAGRLIHPNVVTLFDAGEDEGTLYLAMEYVEGTSLGERLASGDAVPLAEALRIAREAAAGLAFAHRQGVVHRDVKPANLLLAADGPVKVSDFGIAKVVGQATELTMTGTVVGSPHYLSPEQVRGERLDARSDLFSLGVVFYELLGGRRPFDGETLTTLVYQILHQEPPPMPLRPDLAPRLIEVLSRLLAKDREDRFDDGETLVDALAALEGELPAEVLAAPAVVTDGVEPTRLLPATGAHPTPAATRPGEGPGEEPATRPAADPPPPPPPGGAGPPPPPPGGVRSAPAPTAGAASSSSPATARQEPGQAGAVSPARERDRPRSWRAGVAAAFLAMAALAVIAVVVAHRWGPPWVGSEESQGAVASALKATVGTPGGLTTGGPGGGTEGAAGAPAPAGEARAAPPGEETALGAGEPSAAVQDPARAGVPAPGEEPGGPPAPASGRETEPASAVATETTRAAPEPASAEEVPPEGREPDGSGRSGASGPAAGDASAPPPPTAPGSALSPRARRLRDALRDRPAAREAVQELALAKAPDQVVETGLALTVEVHPAESFVLVDGTVIGRASELDPRVGGEAYRLPGPGEHLMTLRAPSMVDHRVLLRAAEGAPAAVVRARLQPAPAAELDLGDLPLIRVREAVGFAVRPPTARIAVDGRPVGRAEQYPGRFARPRTWLRLPPGRHRVSVVAPGFERRDFAVDVSSGAAEARERIEVRLRPAGEAP